MYFYDINRMETAQNVLSRECNGALRLGVFEILKVFIIHPPAELQNLEKQTS